MNSGQTKTSKKRVFYVHQGIDEDYLKYDARRGLLYYAARVKKRSLPAHLTRLLEHYTAFAAFIDDLSERILKTPVPSPSNNGPQSKKNSKRPCTKQEEEEEEEETMSIEETVIDRIDMHELCSLAWAWYHEVIARDEPLTTEYAYSYVYAWSSFARLFYLTLRSESAEKARRYSRQRLGDHAYNQLVAPVQCIIVSGYSMARYSTRDLYESARLVVSTLYRCQYSEDMKQYLHILFFRYATFLSLYYADDHQFDSEDDDDDDGETVEEIIDNLFDDPSFVEYREMDMAVTTTTTTTTTKATPTTEEDEMMAMGETYDEYKKHVRIPVHRKYCLKYGFVEAGELLFGNQLRRIDMSSKLATLTRSARRPDYTTETSRYYEVVNRCLQACCAMIRLIAAHPMLYHDCNEEYMRQTTHIHMYHSEKESFVRAWPGSSDSPGDVMNKLRPNDNLRVAQTRKVPLSTLCAMYEESVQKVLGKMKESSGASSSSASTTTNLYAFYNVQYEREIVLLTQVCIRKWCDFQEFRRVQEMKTVFIIEEMSDAELIRIDDIVKLLRSDAGQQKKKKTTTKKRSGGQSMVYLIKLVQVYYIIDTNTGDDDGSPMRIYATHFFVEAFVTWLAWNVQCGVLASHILPPTLIPLVELLGRLHLLWCQTPQQVVPDGKRDPVASLTVPHSDEV